MTLTEHAIQACHTIQGKWQISIQY